MVGMHEFTKDATGLKDSIRRWGKELGFDAIGFSGIGIPDAERKTWPPGSPPAAMATWIIWRRTRRPRKQARIAGRTGAGHAQHHHRAHELPSRRRRLFPVLAGRGQRAFISRYALGRDYHKLLRGRLQRLADRITAEIGEFAYRVFTDSAPVMEVGLAQNSGLGWRGKHTLLLDREAGSYFFLGEIFTDLALPPDAPVTDHCGTCRACLDACPTRAIVAPWRLDARLCISYLTIELKGSIPEPLRPLLGNRIYGCDDCQLACPWNRAAPLTRESDFAPRHGLDRQRWSNSSPGKKAISTNGWPARRSAASASSAGCATSRWRWATPRSDEVLGALRSRAGHPSEMVREHVQWALRRHGAES
jgi:epoxyqueuosine reductase